MFHLRNKIINPCPNPHFFSNKNISWNLSWLGNLGLLCERLSGGLSHAPRPLGTSIYLSTKQGQYLILRRWCHFSYQNWKKTIIQTEEILFKNIFKCLPCASAIQLHLSNIFIEFKTNKQQRTDFCYQCSTSLHFTAHTAFYRSKRCTMTLKQQDI